VGSWVRQSREGVNRGPGRLRPAFALRMLAALATIVLPLAFAGSALAAEEHGYISGRVTAAATGDPIAGVKVCAVPVSTIPPWECTTTNGNGEYTVPAFRSGQYEVRFTAPAGSGYVERSYYDNKYSSSEQETVSVTLGATISGIDAQLPEGGQILGMVTDATTKEPVAEVEVCAGPVECVITNARGGYTISGLPGGEYQVSFGFGYGGNLGETFITPEYYKNKVFTSFSNEPNKVSVPLGGVVAGINQELEEFSHITGRVINSVTKAPIAGIQVYASTESGGGQGSTETNSNGEYTLSHLADRDQEYYLEFEVPSNSGINYFSQHYGGRSVPERGYPVKVSYGHTASGINAELEEGGEITGRVINAVTKAPITGINICSHPMHGGEYKCAWTGSNGDYVIELLESGEYRVEFDNFNDNYAHQYYDGKINESEAAPVLVTLGHATDAINAEMVPEPPLDLVWTGERVGLPTWSDRENWVGAISPGNGTAIGTLSFPAIGACPHGCYSRNDLAGLTVESLDIDDGENYEITGEPFTLGAGGLSASPAAATSEPTLAEVSTPIVLGSSQAWKMAGLGAGQIGDNGLLLSGGLSGASSELTVDMEDGGTLYLAHDNELGPVNFDGANTHQAGIFNGVVGLLNGRLNVVENRAVDLNHVFLIGAGTLGQLRSVGSEIDITTAGNEGGTLEAQSVELESQSDLELEITGSGPNAGIDYSDLYSPGAVELGGATLGVHVAPPKAGEPCPTLLPNQIYTLVSSAGTLSGAFANAPQGTEIPIEFAKACTKTSQSLRIEYHQTEATKTVTATVVGGPESSTALSVLPSDPTTNQSVTLTATVHAAFLTPSGSVEFKNGAEPIASCSRQPVNQAGTATCLTTFTAAGSPVHLTAVFTPSWDLDLQGSISAIEDLPVGKSPTTTRLRVSEATPTVGQSDIYTASVFPPDGGPTWPSGSVEFLDEGTPIPGCEAQPIADEASCQVTVTAAGAHSITAVYLGDANFTGSSSTAVGVTVQAQPSIAANTSTGPLTTTTGPITAPPVTDVAEASLADTSITVTSAGLALVKLECSGAGKCHGKLTLSAKSAVEARGKKRKTERMVPIGIVSFATSGAGTTTVKLNLDVAGRVLLRADGGRLTADLALELESSPAHTGSESVHLVQQKSRGKR
jgi:hypothetical protein